MGLGVGDVVPVAFWDEVSEAGDPNVVNAPVGIEHLTVVGIATFPDEVLPDGLFTRYKLIVSPEVAGPYGCMVEAPARDATFDEMLAQVFPEGCSLQYRYYSLAIAGGDGGVRPALEAFLGEADQLNAGLPVFEESSPTYFLIATTTAQERQRVERSNQPTVAALVVLGLAAAAVTAVVLVLAVARELRRRESDQQQWRELGLTVRDRVWVLAAPLLAAALTGLLIAVPLSWLFSPVSPVGLVRSVEPDPGRHWSAWAGLGLLGLAAVCGLGVVALVYRHSRGIGSAQQHLRRREVGLVSRMIAGSARPETAEGVRAAYGGHRGAGLVVASGGVAAAVFLGAVVFGSSLAAVVSTPASYGWPWDLAVMTGAGYGDLDAEGVDATLGSRADVEGWSLLGFTNQVTIDDATVLGVIGFDEQSTLDIKVVDGHLPAGTTQVALGSRTAAELGLEVGDQATFAGSGINPTPVTVTGIVVLPPLGPLNADRAAPGVGLLLPAAMADDPEDSLVSFVGIDLAPGTDGVRWRASCTT
jgi:hypothetical protein